MSNRVFPALAGLSWGVKRTPTYQTLMSDPSPSAQCVRIPMRQHPTHMFEVAFEVLRDNAADELNTLMGFFHTSSGCFDSFLLDLGALTNNQADSSASDQPLTIDANSYAAIARAMGQSGYLETIFELKGPPIVKDSAGTVMVQGVDYHICNLSPVAQPSTQAAYAAGGSPYPPALGSDATVDWDAATVSGSTCVIHAYGRVLGAPDATRAAPVNFYFSDGTTFSKTNFSATVSLSTTYWVIYDPVADNWSTATSGSAAAAAVASGKVCVGSVHTPNVSNVGGTTVSSGMGLAVSGYAGYFLKFVGTPAQPARADFGWYYRVMWSSAAGSSSDPTLGADQQMFEAMYFGIYQAQQVTLVTARE